MPLARNKDSRCYGCGPDNQLGLRMSFSPNGAHGSQVCARLIVNGWVMKQRRRVFESRAQIRIDGSKNTLLAEADATMCLIGHGVQVAAEPPGQEDSKIVSH
jgi:hypothetical protein